jgi:hypothetical protein
MTTSRQLIGMQLKDLDEQVVKVLGVVGEHPDTTKALTDRELLVLAAWTADDADDEDGEHSAAFAIQAECDTRLALREKQAVRFAAVRNQIRLTPEQPF